MKKGLYSAPDPFSISPLLLLLPVRGDIARLQEYKSSLYARFENVQSMKSDADVGEFAPETWRGLEAEEAMLRAVLDWLAESPEGGGAHE